MKFESSFIFQTDAWLLMFGLLVLMLVCVYAGVQVHRRQPVSSKEKKDSRGAIMSAMLALFAFLLAFTFGMSGSRFDHRRQVVVDEANAIGTAVLRADLYPDSQRVSFRNDFRQYVEARIAYYEHRTNLDEVQLAMTQADKLGKQIWNRVAALSGNRDLFVASNQMVPALNLMFDLRTTRTISELSRVPDSVVYMLFFMALVSAFFLGYTLADSLDWISASAFCLLTVVIIHITLDLDRPRRGLIDLSASHQAMVELKGMF